MYKINGINHSRYVGIDKISGTAGHFYLPNIGGYRSPENEEEEQACKDVAYGYYLKCMQHGTAILGGFSLIRVYVSSIGENTMIIGSNDNE